MRLMATRTTRLNEGRANGKAVRLAIGGEIRRARIGAGVSQREAGRLAGLSHSQFGRIERGVLIGVSVDHLSRACSAVGLRLLVRAVPGAGPVVDAGQLALLDRFRRILQPGTRLATEVPLPLPGDLRAWDGMLSLEGRRVAIEAESRLGDIQALDRRMQLKLRDDDVGCLILVVGDTAHNRAVLDLHREALRSTFPWDGRQILPALRAGRPPAANGIVVV